SSADKGAKGAKDGQRVFILHDGVDPAGARQRLPVRPGSDDGHGAGERDGVSGVKAAGGRGLCGFEVGAAEYRAGGAAAGAEILRSDQGGRGGAGGSAQAVSAAGPVGTAVPGQTETGARERVRGRDALAGAKSATAALDDD